MFKKAIKIFSIPVILAIVTILFHFYVEQTLLTWIFAKFLVVITLIAHIGSFILLFDGSDDLFTEESLLTIRDKTFSFLGSTTLVLLISLGYYAALLIPIYLIYSLTEIQNQVLLIIPSLLSLLAFYFSVKFFLAPIISVKEDKKITRCLSKSKEIISGKDKILFLSVFLFLSVVSNLLMVLIDYFKPQNFSIYLIFGYLLNYIIFIILAIFLSSRYEFIKPKETGKIRKILWGILALFGAPGLIFILIFSFSIFFRDYDPDYEIPKSMIVEFNEEIEEGSNLYYFLIDEGFRYNDKGDFQGKCGQLELQDPNEIEEIENYDNDYYKFIKENPQKAKEIVEENSEAYKCIDKIADYDYHLKPFKAGIDADQETYIPANFFKLARVNSFYVIYLNFQGEEDEALNRAVSTFKVGGLLSDEKNYLIDFLIGSGVKSIALKNIDKINFSEIDNEALLKNQKTLANFENTSKVIEDSIKIEYMRLAGSIENSESMFSVEEHISLSDRLSDNFNLKLSEALLSNHSFFYKPNKTKKDLTLIMKHHLDMIDFSEEEKEYYLEYPSFSKKMDNKYIDNLYNYTITDNAVGRILNRATFLAANFNRQFEQAKEDLVLNRINQLRLALYAYKNDHDDFPETLKQLTPDYLSEIPEDPFNEGNPLKYSKEEGRIFSVEAEDNEDDPDRQMSININ